ncbi:MAG: DUF5662 family protein [Synergistaceae bacterium]
MKLYRISENLDKQMRAWYEKRTNAHIDRVQKYCKKIAEFDDKYNELIERGKVHDQSKFEDPEIDPYIYITWKYKCKDDGMDFQECNPPDDIEDQMFNATMHHIKNNRHHPEFHAEEAHLNKNDRDRPPDEKVDATKMKDIDIGEMVCDWCAVSDEKGGTPADWAKKNINVRWTFTDEQEALIYELIDAVWDN